MVGVLIVTAGVGVAAYHGPVAPVQVETFWSECNERVTGWTHIIYGSLGWVSLSAPHLGAPPGTLPCSITTWSPLH